MMRFLCFQIFPITTIHIHFELGQGEDLQTIHSTIFKDDEVPLFPNFPNHSNPHTPPISINLLRSPTKIKLIKMGKGIPMVYEGLPNPLTAQTPYLPSYLAFEKNMAPKFLLFPAQETHTAFQINLSFLQVHMCW